MREIHFTSELDDNNRISVPPTVAASLPRHAKVEVVLHLTGRKLGQSTGALQHYMDHPIEMPGILPFNRDDIYPDRG